MKLPLPANCDKNAVVSAEVIGVNDGGIEVRLVNHEDVTGLHPSRRSLARSRRTASGAFLGRPDRRRAVTNFSKKDRKIQLSIKALEIAEEKEAVAHSALPTRVASLGDILGAALKNRQNNE